VSEDAADTHRSVKAEPLAIAALSVALAAFVMDCCCTYLGPVLSVIAIILGVVVVAKARKGSRAALAIGGSAIAAGVVNLLLFVLLLVFYAAILTRGGGDIFPVYPDGPPPHADSGPLGAGGPLLPSLDAGAVDASPRDGASSVAPADGSVDSATPQGEGVTMGDATASQ
jgi:hypothetical protein